jgi:xylan 1,4-beta-xylosidase
MNSEINGTRNSKLNMARALLLYTIVFSFQASFCQQSPIAIEVNAAKTLGDMKPFWSFFGYDEPNFTTRENGKKLLRELKELSPETVFVRTHQFAYFTGK